VNIARIAVAPALAVAIAVGGFAVDASADSHKGKAAVGCEWGVAEGPAVVITGGSVSNETNINVSANGGAAVADASGGSNNFGVAGGGGGVETAVVGGGGGANAGANGGAIALGDVNSGSNSGNAIIVGNTTNCAPAPEVKPAPGKKDSWVEPVAEEVYMAPEAAVVALPATGVGGVDAGLLSMIFAAGAAGVAGLGLRRRS
jgi:hypothetical protein